MGMQVDGIWDQDTDGSMVAGTYRREPSPFQSSLTDQTVQELAEEKGRFDLIASADCPWSHGAVIVLTLARLDNKIAIRLAGGPRFEGYGLLRSGPHPD